MNVFETIREEKDMQAGTNNNLADAAVAEIKEKIKDQILYLKENSKDINIKHHLKEINSENKEDFLKSLSGEDMIDFNEVILKGNWKEYLARKKEEKLTKYEKDRLSDKSLAEKDKEGLDPAGNFKLSFKAMIDHYAKNLEIEELEKNKEIERLVLKDRFIKKLDELEKKKPHVVAEIKNLDLDLFRRPDYEVVLNLKKDSLDDYERGLTRYFVLKTDSKAENRSSQKKAEMIISDQRFRYYCALRELLEIEGPCNPQIFLN